MKWPRLTDRGIFVPKIRLILIRNDDPREYIRFVGEVSSAGSPLSLSFQTAFGQSSHSFWAIIR